MLDARALLKEAGLSAKKSFGQNFLVAPHVLDTIAEACVPEGEVGKAFCVELGAGLGALTSALTERASRVVAVERDRDLVPILGQALAAPVERGLLHIVEGDAQSVDYAAFFAQAAETDSRVLCGNLPYQITGRLLQTAVNLAPTIHRAVFMVQDEVASRLLASPGSKEYGALTVFVTAAFNVRKVMTVSSGCFHPMPDVTSAVVCLTALSEPRARETDTFRSVVRAAFAARRKTLRNAWKPLCNDDNVLHAMAEAAGTTLSARGETLHVTSFARAAEVLEQSACAGHDSSEA